MRVQVLYFGVLKDLFKREREDLHLADESSVGDLMTLLKGPASAQAGLWKSIAVAVNQEYVQSAALLHDGDEVALLPPVSGGLKEGH
jgi:molybdopterin converting factor subunit 1